jgi:hypothetical protein
MHAPLGYKLKAKENNKKNNKKTKETHIVMQIDV